MTAATIRRVSIIAVGTIAAPQEMMRQFRPALKRRCGAVAVRRRFRHDNGSHRHGSWRRASKPCSDDAFFFASICVCEFISRPSGVAQEWIKRQTGT